MGLNTNDVYLLGPDQAKATGAISKAPVGTALPTDARTALPAAWATNSGYVSESGVTLNIERSTANIHDWGLKNVRVAYTDFGVTITFEFLAYDEFAAKAMFGDDNVTVTAATTTAGQIIAVNLTSDLPPAAAWCFNMKDGDRRARIAVPNGQVTTVGSSTFAPGAANIWPVTLTCFDDGNGTHAKLIFDNGEMTSL